MDENRTTDEKGTEVYNSRDQLVSWHRATANTGQLYPGSTVDYVLNGAGAVTRVTDHAGPDTINHLDGDRLTSSTSGTQTSDYGYDGLGNLVSIHNEANGASTTNDVKYTFDSFERLIASSDPTQSKSAAYTYDGLDRRDTQTADGNKTTYGYIASTSDLSQETVKDHNGALVERKSYDYDTNGARQGQQVLAGTSSTYRTYVTDAQGSVQGFEDPTGNILGGTHYHYDPYGTPQDTTPPIAPAQDNPFRFQGFYYDPAAGSYNAQAREYRPDVQRFLTQDRYEAAGSDLNLATNPLTGDRYAYVAGNPTSRIDYDGHKVLTGECDQCQITVVPKAGGGVSVSHYDPRPARAVAARQGARIEQENSTRATLLALHLQTLAFKLQGVDLQIARTDVAQQCLPFSCQLSDSQKAAAAAGFGGAFAEQYADASMAYLRKQRSAVARSLVDTYRRLITKTSEPLTAAALAELDAAAARGVMANSDIATSASKLLRIGRFAGRAVPLLAAALSVAYNLQSDDLPVAVARTGGGFYAGLKGAQVFAAACPIKLPFTEAVCAGVGAVGGGFFGDHVVKAVSHVLDRFDPFG